MACLECRMNWGKTMSLFQSHCLWSPLRHDVERSGTDKAIQSNRVFSQPVAFCIYMTRLSNSYTSILIGYYPTNYTPLQCWVYGCVVVERLIRSALDRLVHTAMDCCHHRSTARRIGKEYTLLGNHDKVISPKSVVIQVHNPDQRLSNAPLHTLRDGSLLVFRSLRREL